MNASSDYARTLIEKAHGDYFMLLRFRDEPQAPIWGVGFHAQQAVEKAIKAVLSHGGVTYPFMHDLLLLVELLRTNGIPLPPEADDVPLLTPFGAVWRYDDPVDDDCTVGFDWMDRRAQVTIDWAESRLKERTPSTNAKSVLDD